MSIEHRVSIDVGGDDHAELGPNDTTDRRPTLGQLAEAVEALQWANVSGDARVELEVNLFRHTPTHLVAYFEE